MLDSVILPSVFMDTSYPPFPIIQTWGFAEKIDIQLSVENFLLSQIPS